MVHKQKKLTDFWQKIATRKKNESHDSVIDCITLNAGDADRIIGSKNDKFASKNRKKTSIGRKGPPYKRIPGTSYVVDGFNYKQTKGISAYFLSHFHADHYNGLKRGFSKPIYCSQVTGNLLKLQFGIKTELVRILPLNKRAKLNDQTTVTLFDANHCPGSVLMLFETVTGTYLHTGDMRADKSLIDFLKLQIPKLDALYLDTTYMHPRFIFPPQDIVIEEICHFVRIEVEKEPKTMILCGTYTIGKEKVLLALSDILNSPIFVEKKKMSIMRCLENENLAQKLTRDFQSTNLFAVFGFQKIKQLGELLAENAKFKKIISIWPSGWEYRKNGPILSVERHKNVIFVGAPYSEHSSYAELEWLIRTLRPKKTIPTVNVRRNDQMQKILAQWLGWVDISCYFSIGNNV